MDRQKDSPTKVSTPPEFPTLPLVLQRDDIAKRIYDGRNRYKHLVGDGKVIQANPFSTNDQAKSLGEISSKLGEARIVLFRADLLDFALHNHYVFGGTKFPLLLLPTLPMWFPGAVLEKSRHFKAYSKGLAKEMRNEVAEIGKQSGKTPGNDWRYKGLLLYPFNGSLGSGMVIAEIFETLGHFASSFCKLLVNETVPLDESKYMMITAMLSFMAQDFVQKQTFRLPKRFNGFRQEYTPCINQVMLRAKKSEVVPGSAADTEAHKEWAHCWTVRAHARRLHKPRKLDGQQVIWINPFVKGPTDKPMLPPRDTIVKVNR